MNMKRGTPKFGIVLGIALVAIGVLIMLIGFWKTLVLALLFAAGYFIGTVDDKSAFMKKTVNKLVPDKEVKMIDLKSELSREQELKQAARETNEPETAGPETATPETAGPEKTGQETAKPETTEENKE